MTRKDYKLIAQALKCAKGRLYGPDAEAMRLLVAHEISALLADENDNFDAERFIEACDA